MSNAKSGWSKIIESINKPLGFFALALLIVEAFLATVLIGSNLEPQHKYCGMWIGVGMFLLVVLIVGICVWVKPRNLMYDQYGHLVDSGKIPYGTNLEQLSAEQIDKLPQKEEKPPQKKEDA
jgi:heme A synthase